jgi:nucleotide-binding universal stress UspA family protein
MMSEVASSQTKKVISMLTFQKILCPTDFSEASYEGIARAVELALRNGGELCIIHVGQPASELTPLAGIAPYAQSESVRRAEAVASLCSVLDERVPSCVRSRPLLKFGNAAEEIVRAAREEAADVIVLTTHGGCGWRPGVLGAVAEEVLRKAQCPVLTFSGPASERQLVKAAANGAMSNGTSYLNKSSTLRPELELVSSHAIFLDGD